MIWNTGNDLESSIKLLKHYVDGSGVFSVRVSSKQLGPKIYLDKTRNLLAYRSRLTSYVQVIGEYENERIVFNITENMLGSIFQVLIGFILIILGIVFAESGQWLAIGILPLAFVLVNVFLFYEIKMEVLYYEKRLRELLSKET